MARITAYYNYSQKSGKHTLTLSTPWQRNKEFIVDTSDYRRSSVMDFLTVMEHSACSLIFDYQHNSFDGLNDVAARKTLHEGAAELAKGLATMLSGLMMLRQTPTSSVTPLMDLYRRLQGVSGMSGLMGIIKEWTRDLHIRPLPFYLTGSYGTIEVKDYSDIIINVTIRTSQGKEINEITLRREVSFDERCFLDIVKEATDSQ